MDYNDIQQRLQRIYASIDQKSIYGAEALNEMRTDQRKLNDSTYSIEISFGDGENGPKTINRIQAVISNIANLKDCLKTRMRDKAKNQDLIEDLIKSTFALQLVLDLSNQEKHGYPLTKIHRSKKNPIIKNIRSALGPSNKPNNIVYSGPNGSRALNVMVSILADITDGEGVFLCTFDQLIEQSVGAWEQVISEHSLQS